MPNYCDSDYFDARAEGEHAEYMQQLDAERIGELEAALRDAYRALTTDTPDIAGALKIIVRAHRGVR
jgi:hypothetical protein